MAHEERILLEQYQRDHLTVVGKSIYLCLLRAESKKNKGNENRKENCAILTTKKSLMR